jgi:two-component system, LytTR family, response regulator
MTYSTIIVDDEESGRENLRLFIEDNCPELNVIAMAANAFEAKLRIEELKPDIIFLDVNMGAISGVELLESLIIKEFQVIFVTAYKHYALQTLKLGAVGYVLKPIILEELVSAVNLAKEMLARKKTEEHPDENELKEDRKILIRHHTGYRYVASDEIIYAEAFNNYCTLHLIDNESITVSKTLKWLMEQLDSNQFYRAHKTHLVNLSYIKHYQSTGDGVIVLKNNVKIKVAVSKRAELRKILAI